MTFRSDHPKPGSSDPIPNDFMPIPYTPNLPNMEPPTTPVPQRLRTLQDAANANGVDLASLLAGRDPGAFTEAEWAAVEAKVNNPF